MFNFPIISLLNSQILESLISIINLNYKISKKICQLGGDDSCAHQLSKSLCHQYPQLMNGDGRHYNVSNGFMRCGCGAAVRAKQIRAWAANKGQKVKSVNSNGIFIIFQYNYIEGGGHVWGKLDGKSIGNGYYDWPHKHEEFYQLR